MFFLKNYVSVKKHRLNKYSKTSAGNKQGSFSLVAVERYDDKYALFSSATKEWYFQDPKVTEYLVDIKILDDISNIVTKNRMNFWNNKNFTDKIIFDEATLSYCFSFGRSLVSFSSQNFPKKYSDKLSEIDKIIASYLKNTKKLPGLVLQTAEENTNSQYKPVKNAVGLYVCQYSQNKIYYKIVNDSKESYEYINKPVIRNLTNNNIIFEATEQENSVVAQQKTDSKRIILKERLETGIYELNLGDLVCTFEIAEN